MSPQPVIASASHATDAARAMGLRKAGPFSAVLCEVAREREEIVAMSADLRKYTDLLAFSAEFPDRYIEVGMAEQNLVAAAAGLARSGLTVVASSFAAFLTRRAQDFTIMQVALARADVKLIGAVPGISATFGPSHTAVDDLAIMRAAPNMVVIDPCDPTETAQALRWALDYDGPVYLRQPFNRAATARPVSDSLPSFELGKCHVLREGTVIWPSSPAAIASSTRSKLPTCLPKTGSTRRSCGQARSSHLTPTRSPRWRRSTACW